MENIFIINNIISTLEASSFSLYGIQFSRMPHESVQHIHLINQIYEQNSDLRYTPIEYMLDRNLASKPDGVIYDKNTLEVHSSIQLKFKFSEKFTIKDQKDI